ncbi:tyrosine-type recombinase/integrase [Acinetobacter soli]|uniref:tyrosine-type recombinase/integrase n=1 Tax=Acinetobacter soli TaxID=487316 RepID=UPI001D0B9A5F|nr:site-specific integrase [Acinetobacter soli]MCB8769554.1 site-specific integrase [Acinetobacter soli]
MKIPKPRKRGDSYRIELMFEGKRISATRDTEKECEQWAALKLLELKTGKALEEKGIKPQLPFKQLCEKYYIERGSKLKSAYVIRSKLDNIDKILGELATKSIYDFTPNDIVRWRNKRVLEVQSSTALREFAMFSAIFSYAEKELFLLDSNVWTKVVKPLKGKPRSQRITLEDQDKIFKRSKWDNQTAPYYSQHYVGWSLLFALETAMRQGEILSMRREHLRDGYIHLPMTKNGESRDVPLSAEARRLISLLPADNDFLVPVKVKTFKRTWIRMRDEAGLNHINFHDTRHEAITRMVKNRKLPVEVLAKITGHRTIGILINTYYNPDAQDLVEMFNSSES